VTLPQHLLANGYHTLGAGKVFHRYPDPQSWAEYFPSQRRTKPPDPMPPHRPLNGIQGVQQHLDWGPVDVGDEEMGDWQVTDWARKALGKSYGRSFFLACGLYRPHLPWYVPRRYFDRFPLESIALPKVKEDDLDDVPPLARKLALTNGDHARIVATDNWRRAVQGYLACVAFADACVGRLVEALEASRYRDDTVIVLWSDHGWHLGPKLHWRKWTLWEEATRNPLIVAAPGVTQAGGRCARPVSLLDLYPTLVDLCDVPGVDGTEGVSLLPLLRDPEADRGAPAVTTCGRGNHSVRSERWRYTRYHDGTEELYDHADDPLEWTNLAAKPQHAQVKVEHTQWLPRNEAPPSPHEKGHENGGTEAE
jgi:arylsulfatase A-like enzyme